MTVAAAVTNGDSDQLMTGRNGVFYDRQGRDWDATVVRIVDHPISIRQAFWAPYKRIGKMVGEQIQKMAAARSKGAEDKAAASLMQAGTPSKEKQTPQQQAFDVGKFAGIFAAIGLAVGAIGTAIASVVTGFIKLPWWQMPLAVAGMFLLVSGPSIVIAWFKLHQRNLGPILDANGWAVNARARLNIPFGASLTGIPRLPEGAHQSFSDPYAEKKKPWKSYILLLAACILLFMAWQKGFIKIPVTCSTAPSGVRPPAK
jgi:MFS family permease